MIPRGILPRLAMWLLDFTLAVRESRRRVAHARRAEHRRELHPLDTTEGGW